MSRPKLSYGRGGCGPPSFTNWAQTYQCRPARVLFPTCEAEVVDIIVAAREQGTVVRAVGAGHSPSDIACTTGEMVCLARMNRVTHIDPVSQLATCEAGIELAELHEHLDRAGLAMPNLGSISEQSLAGLMATGSHGSSAVHGILPEIVHRMRIVLASGETVECSPTQNAELFHAALIGLGSIGIVTSITIRTRDRFDICARQEIISFTQMLTRWDELWHSAEFVRMWYWPYVDKVVLWRGDAAPARPEARTNSDSGLFDRMLAYAWRKVYETLLLIGKYVPKTLPLSERFIFWLNHARHMREPLVTVARSHEQLNMNCFFLQYTDEWSIADERVLAALVQLREWVLFNADDKGGQRVYMHAPFEIRRARRSESAHEAWLSPVQSEYVTFIGTIMYKPFNQPVKYRRMFTAYEQIMMAHGGRPHWAKAHALPLHRLQELYPRLDDWRALRDELDPGRMFVNEHVERHLYPSAKTEHKELGFADGALGRAFKAYNAYL